MARTGEERLRELRMQVEQQNAELKLEIDSKANDVKMGLDRSEISLEERRALVRKKRLEGAQKQDNGTWSYGWIASIIFGCSAIAVLICLFLFGGTPVEATQAKQMIMQEEMTWEKEVEQTYGNAVCPRPDQFPIECHGPNWLTKPDRCTSLFIYRGWDIDWLKQCGLISGNVPGGQ